MAYLINKSDGTVLTTVSDGQIDNLSTDLVLIGKNYSGFGEALNENFVKLLENFAGVSRPTRPIRGQLWFDTAELKIKVYNGTAFQPVSSATISKIQPTTLTPGDLWFNETDNQLYFFDGENAILLAPIYSESQGISGLQVRTILDTQNQSRVVTLMYNNGSLLGIFSKDAFTPKVTIEGFSGSIVPGFNQGTLPGFKIVATATNSESLGGAVADLYVRTNRNSVMDGRLGAREGFEFGDTLQHSLLYASGNMFITNTVANRFVTVSVNRGGSSQETALQIEPASRTIKFYEGKIDSTVDMGGNLMVNGNLTVNGDVVTVNTSTVSVEDKNIELARNAASNGDADGGGITLKGGSGGDKSLSWVSATGSWTSDQNFNVVGTEIDPKVYKLNGTTIIEPIAGTSPPEFRLTSAITEASGIVIYGTQDQFTINNLFIDNNKITAVDDTLGGITGANIDIELEPKGAGNIVLAGSPRITGMADPTSAQDAATKYYVDTQLQAKSLAFTMDISDGISNSGIAAFLEQIAPVAEYNVGTVARILCTALVNTTGVIDMNTYKNLSTDTFNTPTGTASAVTDVTFSSVTVPSPSITVVRIVKTFQILGTAPGAWTFVS